MSSSSRLCCVSMGPVRVPAGGDAEADPAAPAPAFAPPAAPGAADLPGAFVAAGAGGGVAAAVLAAAAAAPPAPNALRDTSNKKPAAGMAAFKQISPPLT